MSDCPRCESRLAAGRFFGSRPGRFETPYAILTEVVHAEGRELPEHDHALAYFCMLLDGRYVEVTHGRELSYSKHEVGFHPALAAHRDVVGREGGRFLCLEIRPSLFARDEVRLRSDPKMLPATVSLHLLRILRALREETLSELTLESAAWELCGDASPDRASVERGVPAWLARVVAMVEDDYARALTVQEIAREVGLHPVHVAREFRRRHGITLGEYANRVRVRAACGAIGRGGRTLAAVAHAVGFADHAHFCRVFRGEMGCTPSAFAAAVRA
ncbi:MAG TPA: AraC family transcriptional regulator [Usitatibacter sp.]|nr:AraC family transcriptional regulator [Usitatibacter sp.]